MAVGPGLALGAMHGIVHGAGGLDAVSRQAHMHGQMQACIELAKKTGKPAVVEATRKIMNQMAEAERRQMDVLGNEKYLRYTQDFSGVPSDWIDALQNRNDKRHVPAPQGFTEGGNYNDFENRTRQLWTETVRRLNEARKAHGLDPIPEEMHPLHPSRVSTFGHGNFFGRRLGEFAVAGKGVVQSVFGKGAAKGFEDWNVTTLKKNLKDAVYHHARFEDGGVTLPKSGKSSSFRYLEGKTYPEANGGPMVRTEGSKLVLLNRDGTPVTTEAQLESWATTEADRFASRRNEFRNVNKGATVVKARDFNTQFPYLEEAHKATFHDVISEIMGMDMEAAALESHAPDIEAQVKKLSDELGTSETEAKLRNFLGAPVADAASASNLMGRIYQQQGRLSSGGGWASDLLASVAPLSYRQALSASPTPGAAQQGQAFSQTMAFMPGDLTYPIRHGIQYGKALGKDVLGAFGIGGPSDLGIPHNKTSYDRWGTEFMDKGTALHNASIEGNAEHIVGRVLRNGNEDWLKMMFTDKDIADLRHSIRPDGSVDLSNKRLKTLGNSVVARYMEGINGLDLPTSKPAAFHSGVAKPFTAFMGTPAIVTKSVTDLYRKGGMLHTGNFVKDNMAKAAVTGALVSQLATSNAIRANGILKAIAILSAGGYAPGLLVGKEALQGYESRGEASNAQMNQMTAAAVQRLMDSGNDDQFVSDLLKITGMGVTGAIPMKLASHGDIAGSFAKSIDQRVMGVNPGGAGNASVMQKAADMADMVPVLGVPVSLASRYTDFMSGALNGEFVNSGAPRLAISRDYSPSTMLRNVSPLFPDVKERLKIKSPWDVGWGGTETKKISDKIGGKQ